MERINAGRDLPWRHIPHFIGLLQTYLSFKPNNNVNFTQIDVKMNCRCILICCDTKLGLWHVLQMTTI